MKNSAKPSRVLCALCLSMLLMACAAQRRVTAQTQAVSRVAPRAKLTLTYLGVAGFQISDGEHVVLIDPYFSRAWPAAQADQPLVPDLEAIKGRAPRKADLILVGHSHYDHALDVAAVALHSGAEVMGTESTAHLARAGGLPAERIIPVQGGEDFAFEGFSVRAIPSLHSALDHKHTSDGHTRIAENVALPLRASDYVEGGTLAYLVRMAGLEVLILSTANFIESELSGIHPDIAIVATGLRAEVHDYTCRLMRILDEPAVVVTNHFDDWRAPFQVMTRKQQNADTQADLDRFEQEVRSCAANTQVIVPTHDVAMVLP